MKHQTVAASSAPTRPSSRRDASSPGAASSAYPSRDWRRTAAPMAGEQPAVAGRDRAAAGTAPHSIGVRLIDTKPDTRIATPIVTANSCSSRPTMPPMNSTGMNTAASDSVIETIVNAISFDPLSAAVMASSPMLHVPDDVLEHDDRIVDDEADRQASAPSATDCRGCSPSSYIDRERADDRRRQRQARNDRRRDVPQEQEDHQDDERDGQQQRELDVVRPNRESTAIGRCGRAAAPTPAAAPASCGSSALIASTICDGVGAGLALDGQIDRARRRCTSWPVLSFSTPS